MTTAAAFENPLGYTCAPNYAPPTYVAASSFRDFIAWGMMECYQQLKGWGTEQINADNDDVYWLRRHFLSTINIGLWAFKRLKQECKEKNCTFAEYQGDQAEDTVSIPLLGWDREDEDAEMLDCRWTFFRYSLECNSGLSCLLFVFDWGEADDVAAWLLESAIVGHGKEVKEVLAEAAAWNEAHKGY